jgi:hypothetical protein
MNSIVAPRKASGEVRRLREGVDGADVGGVAADGAVVALGCGLPGNSWSSRRDGIVDRVAGAWEAGYD